MNTSRAILREPSMITFAYSVLFSLYDICLRNKYSVIYLCNEINEAKSTTLKNRDDVENLPLFCMQQSAKRLLALAALFASQKKRPPANKQPLYNIKSNPESRRNPLTTRPYSRADTTPNHKINSKWPVSARQNRDGGVCFHCAKDRGLVGCSVVALL